MIKFFRKIRQQLLAQGKTSKYLTYALGEIVLVVIGILIALQLNNWNSEKSIQKDSKDFTLRLLNEVQENIAVCNAEILTEQRQIKSASNLLKMFNVDRSLLKSHDLDSLVFIIISKNAIDLNLGTFTEGLNTAKVSTIPSDSLRALLYSLPSSIEKVTISEKVDANDLDNFLTPFLYQHLNWRTMDGDFSPYEALIGPTGFPEHNSLDALDHLLFENLIDNRLYNSSSHLKYLENLNAHLLKLEKLLKQ